MNNLQKTIKKYEKQIGSFAVIITSLAYLSLIEILISNIQGKSSIFIQPLATAINCLFWGTYAYGRKDWYLLIPNILGFILGVLTFISAFVGGLI
jgi:hypothetical protein